MARGETSTTAAAARQALFARIALTVLFAALLWRLATFALSAKEAISYPFGINYGEGIVWEQVLRLAEGQAYGVIDNGLPAIVFHYTPLYHAVCLLLVGITGGDPLAIGRSVAIAATVGSALLVGWLARRAVPEDVRPLARMLVAAVAALTLFCLGPVMLWAPLMRVDMLAVMLALLGFALGLEAVGRPALILPAALAFVAAVYCKQTSIAAAGALFLFLLPVRPRTAFAGAAAMLVFGLAMLAAFAWGTDGRFLRHIFLYNSNRLDLSRLSMITEVIQQNVVFVVVALAVSLWEGTRVYARYLALGLAKWRDRLMSRRDEATLAALFLYLLFTSATLLLLAKSGSDKNYFIEWMAVLSVAAGQAVRPAIKAALAETCTGTWRDGFVATAAPIALAAQIPLVAAPDRHWVGDQQREAEMRQLSAVIGGVAKPVISEDMVLLLRSGHRVMWEPAIFAELASHGVWDERPFVEQIGRGDFAFFITFAAYGDDVFDRGKGSAVPEAVDRTYPVKYQFADYTLHLPRGSPVPSALRQSAERGNDAGDSPGGADVMSQGERKEVCQGRTDPLAPGLDCR